MPTLTHAKHLPPLALATFLTLSPAIAAEPTPEQRLFDPPLATQDLDPTTGPHPQQAVRCHGYPDLMIRETETDSPGTGPSYVVHPTVPGTRPICRAAPSPADTRLDVANQTLIGRKGPYVIYIPADAIGAETFIVLRLSDGHQLYQDNKSSGPNAPSHAGLLAVTLDADTLHLRYQRQVSAPCSLPQDGAACWTKTVKKNHLNRALTPSLADCRATYKTAAVPPSTTSTIVHDVDMIISPTGKTTVLSRGQPACAAPD